MFEQPELHLHEGAARKLAKVFNDTSKQKKSHIVIETHSKELIHEFFQLVRSNSLSVSDLAIYVVERRAGASHYKRLAIEYEEGQLEIDDPWVNAIA